jgi:hypothetical protein
MATEELLQAMDNGPTTLRLQQLLERTQDSRALLEFAQEFRFMAKDLSYLIAEYNKHAEDNNNLHRMLTATSIADWIFYTNKIESTGLPSQGETADLLRSGCVRTQQDKEVMQTFELLKMTYKPDDLGASNTSRFYIDVPTLQKWHKAMLGDIESHAGKFRTHGSEATTTNLIEDKHKYPHHALIKPNTTNMCKCISRLAKYIGETYSEPHNRVLYAFALAAFAQFHFVDIHPFSDGNGRMCRFISKRILDWVCPLPFPQFPQRDLYLRTLDLCRLEMDYIFAPRPLLKLLLQTAIEYYRELLKKLTAKYPVVACVMNTEELRILLEKQSVPSNELEQICEQFETLKINSSFEYTTNDGTFFNVIRSPVVDFEDL